jgi:hypothetical protein
VPGLCLQSQRDGETVARVCHHPTHSVRESNRVEGHVLQRQIRCVVGRDRGTTTRSIVDREDGRGSRAEKPTAKAQPNRPAEINRGVLPLRKRWSIDPCTGWAPDWESAEREREREEESESSGVDMLGSVLCVRVHAP